MDSDQDLDVRKRSVFLLGIHIKWNTGIQRKWNTDGIHEMIFIKMIFMKIFTYNDIHPEENGIRTFKHTLTEMVV